MFGLALVIMEEEALVGPLRAATLDSALAPARPGRTPPWAPAPRALPAALDSTAPAQGHQRALSAVLPPTQ
jgi:hypothetical protein